MTGSDKKLETALNSLGVPTARAVYDDKKQAVQKPPVFIVWQPTFTQPDGYADDDYEVLQKTYWVNIYSKGNYDTLLSQTILAVKAAGFRLSNVDGEIYEETTGYFHRPIEISFLEEV